MRGVPGRLRSDNGSEFIATKLRQFLKATQIETLYIEPGSPWQDVYGKSFNGRLRDELPDTELFADLLEAKPIGLQRAAITFVTQDPALRQDR